MNFIKTFILFLLMLTAIVSVHEFGHFIVAKAFNLYVSEFSIGIGKKLFSRKGKETEFSIRLLPFGGYCAMVGDDDGPIREEVVADIPYERTLKGIAKWKRILVLIAGVAMNFITAFLIVSLVYLSIGQSIVSPKAVINEVVSNSPAYKAGLIKDDEITRVSFENGYSISPETFEEFSDFMSLYDEGLVKLDILRNGESKEINVLPEYSTEQEEYLIGISSYEYSIVDINIFNCFGFGYRYIKEMTKIVVTTIIGLFRGVGLNNLSGPVGIYNATSTAVSYNFSSYLLLVAVLSLNIGLMNLIPIPVLDGGKVVLTVIEMIIGKPINKKFEEIIMFISVMLFVLLFVFATGQDILKIFR